MTESFIPYARQLVEEDDLAAVAEVLRGEYLTTGPAVGRFETALAARTGAAYVASCSSGTSALHLAMLAAGVGPGWTVIVPAITFVATANAALYCGAEVAFADVDPATALLDLASAVRAAEELDPEKRRRLAIAPVDMTGLPADVAPLRELFSEAAIIRDACHSLGAEYRGEPIGSCRFAESTVFSFHPVKHVATGEGGAVATNDERVYRKLLRLRNHGLTRDPAEFEAPERAADEDGRPNPWYYELAELGYNFRLTDIQSALGESQLTKLGRFLARRREIVARYHEAFGEIETIELPREYQGARSAWHLYAARIDFAALGKSRACFMEELRRRGVGSQVHYLPVPSQPFYRRRKAYDPARFPGAEDYYRKCLSLPLYPAMTDEETARVVAAVRAAAGA